MKFPHGPSRGGGGERFRARFQAGDTLLIGSHEKREKWLSITVTRVLPFSGVTDMQEYL